MSYYQKSQDPVLPVELEKLPGSNRFIGFLSPSDPRWAEALGKTPHDLFHLPGYLVASANHEGGTPVLFLLDQGDYGMLVPLLQRSLKGAGKAYEAYSDVASPYGYPCPLYWGEAWRTRLPAMHAQFESFLRRGKVVSLFLRLNPFLGSSEEDLAAADSVNLQGPTVFMNLTEGEGTWKGISPRNRTFITHMLQLGHEVRIDQWDTMDEVLEAYRETMSRHHASPLYFFPDAYFETLRRATAPHFHLATAFTPEGEISGGCFFSEVCGLIQYFLAGTKEAFAASSPSKLLINALRQWGIDHGHHTLNLGGGVGASRDSLFEFKVRLSKGVANFSTVRKILLPDTYRALAKVCGMQDMAGDAFFPVYRKTAEDNKLRTLLGDMVCLRPMCVTEPRWKPASSAHPRNVLITSAGRRNSLLHAFQEAGEAHGVKVFAAEVDPLAPTCIIADAAFKVPLLTDPGYLDRLEALAMEHGIGLIVPTIDPELPILAAHSERFRAKGVHVLVSTPEFIEICADKWNTVHVFGKLGIKVPAAWLPPHLPEDLPEALFVKPRDGSGSLHAYACRRDELDRLLPLIPNPIIQELLVGQEVTMDAFLDFNGTPIHYVPRERIRTLGGESIQGVTIDYPGLNDWLEGLLEVCAKLGARGPITIQAFMTPSGPVLTEVNPRFGGGFPLARAAGGDYPGWILALLRGEPLQPRLGEYHRGLFMTRHYADSFLEVLPWERNLPTLGEPAQSEGPVRLGCT